ncbi:MAG: hypothetical protein ACKVPJ_01760, partial [Chitinophagales bacterium]
IKIHPELKAELEVFELTKLKPDMSIVFANKEMLKKQEAGRVIAMNTWGKYAVGIAAMLMLFIGIKFFNSSDTTTSGTEYSSHTIEKPAFALKPTESFTEGSDSINSVDKIQPVNSSNKFLFADVQQQPADTAGGDSEQQTQKKNVAGNKAHQHVIDIHMATNAVELASIEKLDFVKHRGRIERDLNKTNSNYIYANYVEPYLRKQENNSIIDRYNNTMAFAESIGSILGLGKEENINPSNDDKVKETHIKIFDIEYYNRKKTDK